MKYTSLMRHLKRFFLPAFALLVVVPLSADVTIRYQTDVKFNSALPEQLTAPATKAMSVAAKGSVIRMKGNKGYSEGSGMQCLVDFVKQDMTLLDTADKQFATTSAKDFTDAFAKAMPQMPEQVRTMMAALKSNVESKATGQTAVIQGVESEAREVTWTIEAPGMPNAPTGPMMKMVMQVWTAKAGEALRLQAIRELTAYNLWTYSTMNPMEGVKKMFTQMPGMGGGMDKFMEEMSKNKTVVMRIHADMYMPMMAAMAKQAPQGSNPLGNFDANSPFMQMNQEVVELSTAAVPDSVFQIPEGYKSVSVDEIVKAMLARQQALMKQ